MYNLKRGGFPKLVGVLLQASGGGMNVLQYKSSGKRPRRKDRNGNVIYLVFNDFTYGPFCWAERLGSKVIIPYYDKLEKIMNEY